MTTQTVTVTEQVCDRCGRTETVRAVEGQLPLGLPWFKLTLGNNQSEQTMSLDICSECHDIFYMHWRGAGIPGTLPSPASEHSEHHGRH